MLQNRPRSSKDNGEPYVFKTVISAAAVFVLSVVIIGAVIANADIRPADASCLYNKEFLRFYPKRL